MPTLEASIQPGSGDPLEDLRLDLGDEQEEANSQKPALRKVRAWEPARKLSATSV